MAYDKEIFKKRLDALQKSKKIKNKDIVNILSEKYDIQDDERGQNYSNYKNVKYSCPIDVLYALAEILNVTIDYLLGLEDEPRHTKSVHEATGLSNESVNILMGYNKNNPEIIKMLDTLISGGDSNVHVLEMLFRQLFNDYIASKYNTSELESKEHDALVQKMYFDCQKIVHDSLSEEFDKMEQSKIDSGISVCMADTDLEKYGKFLHNNKQHLDKGFFESNPFHRK